MRGIKYSVQHKAGLWHWRVFGERGDQLGHGATDSGVLSRAEAINFATDPARIKDLERVDRHHLEVVRAKSHQALVDSRTLAAVTASELDALHARHAATMTAVGRSREAIARTRQVLRAKQTLLA